MLGIQTRKPASKRSLSKRGLEFIASFEGFVNHPYNDPAGYATIGYGHLIGRRAVTASDRKLWGTISRAEGLRLLLKDAKVAQDTVRSTVKVKLSQGEYDALVSFIYNCGTVAFRESALLRKLNAGDRAGCLAQFRKWNHAGGRVMDGLTRRRIAECKLFKGTVTAPKKRPRLARSYCYGDTDCSGELLRRIGLVARDLGMRAYIRCGKRSFFEQSALWRAFVARGKRAPLVARPGTSRHETGNAADVQLVDKHGRMRNIGDVPGARAELKARGLCLPVPGESWHVEIGKVWRG